MAITIFPQQPTSGGNTSITNLPLSGSGNLRVDVAIDGVELGQGTSDNSLPVVLAFDQDVAIRPSGPQLANQSTSVTLAADQSALPINFPPTILAPNAAQETGGNLASIAASEQYINQLVETMTLILLELRAMNWQLANITGANPDLTSFDQQIN